MSDKVKELIQKKQVSCRILSCKNVMEYNYDIPYDMRENRLTKEEFELIKAEMENDNRKNS